MSLHPGSQLGPFEILSAIGVGGMGEVYRARDTKLGRDVAIKVLPAEFVADPERRARFEREACLLASLNHPHIAGIHGIELVDGVQALVLELIDGETLRERLIRGPLPVAEALRHATAIAEALEAAHEKGIIHRDLKPANIKITSSGTVKVLDFGLAKITQASGSGLQGSGLSNSPTVTLGGTREGVILGTAAYMSPEQARGQTVDKRIDIWAFGCVLYEMLTGRTLFASDTVTDTLAHILEREPEWRALPEKTPAVVHRLLQRCLEKDPKRRLRDIGDAVLEIDDALTPRAVHDAEPRPNRRGPLAWVLAAVLLVTTLSLGAPFYFATKLGEALQVRAIVAPPDGWTIVGPLKARLAVSPDGQRLAFVAIDRDRRRRLWIRRLDSLMPQLLEGTDDATNPFWSADGRSLGFFSGRRLKRIDASGGAALTVCEVPEVYRFEEPGATWNQDDVIVFRVPRKGLHSVSAIGGTPTPVTREQNDTVHDAPFFLPDGRRFLYRVDPTGAAVAASIFVGALDSDERREIARDVSGQAMYSQGHLLFVRGTTLMAQPFDTERQELSGDPKAIVENVLARDDDGSAFSVSQNGVVAYQDGASSRLVWVDRNGKEIGVLGQDAVYGAVELSNDGTRAIVASDSGRDLSIFDLSRGFPTRFTSLSGGGLDLRAVWSPDDTRIVFNSNRNGRSDLFVRPVSGVAGSEEVLLADSSDKIPYSWSPDGRFVMYLVAANNQDLFYIAVDGDRKPIAFAQTSFSEWGGKFSPDGKWVAYRSYESGKGEVWVAPFPGPGRRTQISTEGVARGSPRWGRDGRELFFLDSRNQLMAAKVSIVDSQLRVDAIVALFDSLSSDSSSYDVSPDGQRFLINRLSEPAATAPPITLIVNWTAGLKK